MDEIIDLRRAGILPNIDEFIHRYPDLENDLREIFPALLFAEQLNSSAQNRSANANNLNSALNAPTEPSSEFPQHLGDFEITQEIGRGGMGVVFSAIQTSLNRPVALKILSRHLAKDPRFAARFLREAQSAARLQHPNIVQVYGNGQDKGFSFYAMQLIDGKGVNEILDDIRFMMLAKTKDNERNLAPGIPSSSPPILDQNLSLPNPQPDNGFSEPNANQDPQSPNTDAPASTATSNSSRTSIAEGLHDPNTNGQSVIANKRYHLNVARLAKQLADALHYAHSNGTIHRDIKPSNLLIDASGAIWITDFGLAKIEADSEITRTGDLIGTLRYIAPEQLNGISAPSCDIYSLGATLYEMLTLQPAIRSESKAQILQQIREREPILPRAINPSIPPDLETITLKSLAKDPRARYSTALDLANDLQRFLDGKPIKARPTTTTERAFRWAKRNKALAATACTLLLGLLVVAVGSTFAAIMFRELASSESKSRTDAEIARQKAVGAEEAMRRQLYISEMNLGLQAANLQGGLPRIQQILPRWTPTNDQEDLRGWEWRYLLSIGYQELYKITQSFDRNTLDFNATHNVLAWAKRNEVYIHDAVSNKPITRIAIPSAAIRCVSIDPSCQKVAAIDWEDYLFLIDIASGQTLRSSFLPGTIQSISWHPSNEQFVLLLSNDDGTKNAIARVDASTLELTPIRTGSNLLPLKRFGFSHNGRSFATMSQSNKTPNSIYVQIWNSESWKLEKSITIPNQTPIALQWSPTDDQIALCNWEGSLSILSVANANVQYSHKLPRTVLDISWSPDGTSLAGACTNSTALIWDTQNFNQKHLPIQHSNQVLKVHFGSDSKTLITADETHSLCVWNIEERQTERTFQLEVHMNSPQAEASIHWSLDDTQILASHSTSASIWSTHDARKIHNLNGLYAHWNFDGTRLSSRLKSQISTWDSRTFEIGKTNNEIKDGRLQGWSPVANVLAGVDDTKLWTWDVDKNETKYSQISLSDGNPDQLKCTAWSPNGDRIAIGTADGIVHLMDSQSLEHVATYQPFIQAIHFIEWKPDGTELAIAAANPTIKIIDTNTGAPKRTLDGHLFEVWGIHWSADGKRLASAGADQQVIVWDPERATPMLNIPLDNEVRAVRWSHDNQQLAAVSQSGLVKIWSAKIGYSINYQPAARNSILP